MSDPKYRPMHFPATQENLALEISQFMPPIPHELEKAVIKCALVGHAEDVFKIVSSQDFYSPTYALYARHIERLLKDRIEPDFLTLSQSLTHHKEYKGDAKERLKTVADFQASDNLYWMFDESHWLGYSKQVYFSAKRRRSVEAACGILQWSTSSGDEEYSESSAVMFDQAKRLLSQASSKDVVNSIAISEIVRDSILYAQAVADGTIQGGVTLGYSALDELIGGVLPGDFVVIAGRPSMGKSALCFCIAEYVAHMFQKIVIIFSLEMSASMLGQRLICTSAGISSVKFRTGNLTDEEWLKAAHASEKLSQLPIRIDDTTGISPADLMARAELAIEQFGPASIIIVDYLQEMRPPRHCDNRTQEVSEIAAELKQAARNLKVPIIALSQLSRAVELRDDRRPMMSDLRESGTIESEADLILMLYRDAYYQNRQVYNKSGYDNPSMIESDSIAEEAEVIIAKQRNGPTKTVKLGFIPELAKWIDMPGISVPHVKQKPKESATINRDKHTQSLLDDNPFEDDTPFDEEEINAADNHFLNDPFAE
jgi:replicative DNA helicase